MLKLTLALLLLGVEGQYRSRRNRVVDGNPQPPRGLPRRLNETGNATGNDTAVTEAPTAAPTTAAPTTVAATAAPTTVAATAAPTTAAATQAPTQAPTTQAATQAATTAAATTASGNGTNVTAIPVARVETAVSMTVKLDLTSMGATGSPARLAVGNAFAYGIHASTCNGVKAMWNTLGECMLGIGKTDGVTFGMAMAIDAELVNAAGDQPGCTAADCYGGSTPAPARVLQETELTNAGTFEVVATGAAVVAQAQVAQSALKAAESGGTFSAANIATQVQTAMERPTMNATLAAAGVADVAALVATVTKAAQEATVTATVSAVTGATPAPSGGSTSDAYTAGVTGVFALVFGALLF